MRCSRFLWSTNHARIISCYFTLTTYLYNSNHLTSLEFNEGLPLSAVLVPHRLSMLLEHEMILTNATLSKVSDIEIQWWSMRKLDF